jgi:plastocyanin
MKPSSHPVAARSTLAAALALVAVAGLAACTPATGNPPQQTTTGAPTLPVATQPVASPPAATQPTATEAPSAATSADATSAIEVRDFELDPADVSIAGSTIALDVTNTGPTVHNVTVRDDAGAIILASRDLREGESETVVAAIAPGTYVLFCSLAGHESLGIKGSLTVTAP